MNVHHFVDEGLGHSSFVIEAGDRTAAIIDPPRFTGAHEALIARLGLELTCVLDTHSHADYVTGAPALAARTGAAFVAPAASRLETPHRPIRHRERVRLGEDLDVVALATPGHTLDHHAYVIEHAGEPTALFSGGSLMVGSVGRTDLCGPELAEPLARQMFRSLHDQFDDLPDDLTVYPTHGSGSFCGAPGGSHRTTTLGRERLANPLLAIHGEEEFVERLLSGFGAFPTYFTRLPELNRLGPRRYDTIPPLAALTPDEVDQRLADGAVIVDVRPISAYAGGHIPGSISNVLRPVFSSWLGWLIEPDRPIVFVVDGDQDRCDLVRQCLDVGLERLVGELTGGIDTWTSSGRRVAPFDLVGPEAAMGQLIDVRQAGEYAAGHVAGARNVELPAITSAPIPAGPLTIMCGHGERAMTGASLIARTGRSDLTVLDGGPDTWVAVTGESLQTGS